MNGWHPYIYSNIHAMLYNPNLKRNNRFDLTLKLDSNATLINGCLKIIVNGRRLLSAAVLWIFDTCPYYRITTIAVVAQIMEQVGNLYNI